MIAIIRHAHTQNLLIIKLYIFSVHACMWETGKYTNIYCSPVQNDALAPEPITIIIDPILIVSLCNQWEDIKLRNASLLHFMSFHVNQVRYILFFFVILLRIIDICSEMQCAVLMTK